MEQADCTRRVVPALTLSDEMQQAKDEIADALNQANAGNLLNATNIASRRPSPPPIPPHPPEHCTEHP